MCTKNDIRDKNLEICQIHHKRKVYNDIVSTLYTLFYIKEIKSLLFEIIGSFEDFLTYVLFLYKFFQPKIYHGFLTDLLAYKYDVNKSHVLFVPKVVRSMCSNSTQPESKKNGGTQKNLRKTKHGSIYMSEMYICENMSIDEVNIWRN